MSPYDAFEVANCRIGQEQLPKNANSDKSVHQNQKKKCTTEKFRKFYPKSKKNALIWSPDDRVMAV